MEPDVLSENVLFVAEVVVLLSPSSKITAIISLTLTAAVPSLTRISPSTPSSIDSNSIVALSVSISAIISPAIMLSPTFLYHFATLPSVIVGDKAGIKIFIVIINLLLNDSKQTSLPRQLYQYWVKPPLLS